MDVYELLHKCKICHIFLLLDFLKLLATYM